MTLSRVLTARVSKPTLADRERILRHADPDTDTGRATAAPASSPPARSILRVIFIVLGVALVLWLLHALKGVLLLVVLAVFFAYLVSPLVDLCRRRIPVRGRTREVPRGLAIVIVYLMLFGSSAAPSTSCCPDSVARRRSSRNRHRPISLMSASVCRGGAE